MLRFDHLSKVYRRGHEEVHAVSDISLNIGSGELLAILGPSGSGKSTLMNLAGLLDRPTRGEVLIANRPVSALSATEMEALRRETIGFVFQQFLLVPTMTALQNVMLPMYFAGKSDAKMRAVELLERVGLGSRLQHLPSQMSGGEVQRVAVARALANNPKILLADEPTGNLDSKTADEVCGLFREIHALGTTVIIVTHNRELADTLPRTIILRDGKVISDVQKDASVA